MLRTRPDLSQGVSVPMTGTLTHHYSVEDSGATLAGFLVDVSLSGTCISPHVYDLKTWGTPPEDRTCLPVSPAGYGDTYMISLFPSILLITFPYIPRLTIKCLSQPVMVAGGLSWLW